MTEFLEHSKVLIAGGCSFTQVPNRYKNWPYFLSAELNYKPFYLGTGASGNDFIANKVLHQLQDCLKTVEPQNILVGVMWSGINRSYVYLSNPPDWFAGLSSNYKMIKNVKITSYSNYYLTNSHWKDELSKIYYEKFYDDVGALIDSIKNILLVQNFCKLHKIRYFFTEYADDTVTNSPLKHHPDVKYLYEMIDLESFIPIKNMLSWCICNSGLDYENKNDNHPTSEMSKKFTETQIIPFLKKKSLI